MTAIDVDGLSFKFPKNWVVSKYDEWSFYRNQFEKMRNGIKAMDLVAIDPDKTAWLIEVKDYRTAQRTKPIEIDAEVHQKVFDTLAALLPAKVNANDSNEQATARCLLGSKKLRVVLHLEQPKKHSFLRPLAINPADVEKKLRRILKPIDAHPLVVEMGNMRALHWSVQ